MGPRGISIHQSSVLSFAIHSNNCGGVILLQLDGCFFIIYDVALPAIDIRMYDGLIYEFLVLNSVLSRVTIPIEVRMNDI